MDSFALDKSSMELHRIRPLGMGMIWDTIEFHSIRFLCQVPWSGGI